MMLNQVYERPQIKFEIRLSQPVGEVGIDKNLKICEEFLFEGWISKCSI